MSEWRRKALKTFPELGATVKRARGIHDLYFTLLADLQGAYRQEQPPQDYIERIWGFAEWCFEPRRNATVRGAVAASFYEHLPHFGPARRELPQRLSRAAFERLMPAFRVTLTAEELAVFAMEFLTAQGLSRRDARRWVSAAT